MSAAATATPARAHSEWQPDAEGITLRLAGDWRGAPAARLAAPPQPLPAGRVRVEGGALQAWDGGLAAALWQRLSALALQRVALDLDALPEGLRDALHLALPDPDTPAPVRPRTKRDALREARDKALVTVAFFGEVVLATGRLLRGRSDMRLADLWTQFDRNGPKSLPIVALVCLLVGLMLAYMGGSQLGRIGAQSYIAEVVTVGMVRELAGLMTGIILAGRLGAAFAAELGTMQANEEIDALRALGLDPVDHLVMPRLLSLLLATPPLMALAALVGVLAGLPAAVAIYGVPPADYLHRSAAALTATHVFIGLFKGMMYVGLLALAGCREGLYAGRNAQAVGDATTAAVVKSLVWIVTAACLSTVLFQSLGF